MASPSLDFSHIPNIPRYYLPGGFSGSKYLQPGALSAMHVQPVGFSQLLELPIFSIDGSALVDSHVERGGLAHG
jgi:hypothetical protein